MEIETKYTLYRKMFMIRACENRIREEYPKNEIKTPVHLSVGSEAIAVGICHMLPPKTKVFGTYRNHAIYLALTDDPEAFFAELYGKEAGCAGGKAGSMHLSAPEHGLIATSAIVGTTIPLAVGAALANRYNGNDDLVVVFFGDGALEEGVFWESMNFACLHRLKILFVCENNRLAIHSDQRTRQAWHSMEGIASLFRCELYIAPEDWGVVDIAEGTNLLMRDQGPWPRLMECRYHRYLEHVGVNEDYEQTGRLRSTTPDPVDTFAQELKTLPDQTRLERIEAGILNRVNYAVIEARRADSPETWGSFYNGVTR